MPGYQNARVKHLVANAKTSVKLHLVKELPIPRKQQLN